MHVAVGGVMTRYRLQLLLSSALLAACGGNVATEPSDDSGTSDAVSDTGTTPSDTAPADTWVPPDTGACTPTADNTMCNESVDYPCGLPFAPSSPPTQEECKKLCAPVKYSYPSSYYFCNVAPAEPGKSAHVYCASCAVGRKPGDLLDEPLADARGCSDPVAVALAEMARIEAASVHAFRRLERTLGELGADEKLRARARRAARDEIAHARRAAHLAKKRGASPRPIRLTLSKPTTFDLALENAVAGCVHETIGVAYLEHQRHHASDPELRALAASLYDDELDHAALSWDLIAFFDEHLSVEERKELRAATERALDDVIDEIGRVHPRVRTALGLPDRSVVAKVVHNLRETLFAA